MSSEKSNIDLFLQCVHNVSVASVNMLLFGYAFVKEIFSAISVGNSHGCYLCPTTFRKYNLDILPSQRYKVYTTGVCKVSADNLLCLTIWWLLCLLYGLAENLSFMGSV